MLTWGVKRGTPRPSPSAEAHGSMKVSPVKRVSIFAHGRPSRRWRKEGAPQGEPLECCFRNTIRFGLRRPRFLRGRLEAPPRVYRQSLNRAWLIPTHQAGFQPAYFHSAEGLSPRRERGRAVWAPALGEEARAEPYARSANGLPRGGGECGGG